MMILLDDCHYLTKARRMQTIGEGAQRSRGRCLTLTVAACASVVFASLGCRPSSAQSLSGLHIGDGLDETKVLGAPPAASQHMGPFSIDKWKLDDGNDLSVTSTTSGGKIVFLESDFGGRQSGAVSDYSGFKFGSTSLADIRRGLGNNGFAFKAGPSGMTPEGLITSNCYQVKQSAAPVVCFMTLLKNSAIPAVKKAPASFSRYALLDSIVLGEMTYMEGIWGEEKMFDAKYRAMDWP